MYLLSDTSSSSIQKCSWFHKETSEPFELAKSKSRISFLSEGFCSRLVSFEYKVYDSVHSPLYVRIAKVVNELEAHKWMHSSQRWGVQRVWPAHTLQDLGHHESYQGSLPPLSAQIPSFLLLLLSTSSSTPSSVYPAVGVWEWTRASDDVILVTPMCGPKCDTLLCLSTCSCTSSCPWSCTILTVQM